MFTDGDFTQFIVVLAWLAGPAGAVAWVVSWSNFLRNIRQNTEDKLSVPGRRLKKWLESGWRDNPEFAWFFYHAGAIAIPGSAVLITTFVPKETLLNLQPVYAWMTIMYAALTVGQFYYQFTKAKPASPVAVQNVFNETKPDNSGGDTTNRTTMNVIGSPAPAAAASTSGLPVG